MARRGLTFRSSGSQYGEAPRSLADLCRSTLAFPLHGWQALYCDLLERLVTERGCRFLVAAPPQFGKTVITSQRLPAYLLGVDPIHRVRAACYNETHAARQGAVVRDIMASAEYRAWFPTSGVSKEASAHEFTTPARRGLRDGQSSFRAMGLLSGFTGTGGDTVIIDDPYASGDDARSETINERVWRWWTQTAKVRISDDCNVVVMFHPYHDDDLMSRLKREGGWEIYRFPAIADVAESEHGTDLTLIHGLREPGEPLSPIRTIAYLESLRASDPFTFAAQFQGVPLPDAGGMFRVSALQSYDESAGDFTARVRAWDIASTSGAGDYTAGVLMGKRRDGRYVILDAVLLQGSPDEVDRAILETAATDGKSVRIRLAEDPGSAGKRDVASLIRLLSGYIVRSVRVSGSKESRARALSSQVNAGNVAMPESFGRRVATGPHRGRDTAEALRRMFQGFPFGAGKKDGVDAAADAFAELSGSDAEPKKPAYNPALMLQGARRTR